MSFILITGRLPALSMAELEAVFTAEGILSVNPFGIEIKDQDDTQIFDRLGGTQKAAKVLTRLDGTDWKSISSYVKKSLPDHLQYIPEGKIIFGMSAYGIKTTPKAINGTALEIKRIIKQYGRSTRVIPNKNLELNTAQVFHNKLASPNGLELLFIKDGNQTILAQTVWVQDIDAYAARDQARPMRDARVGMLPPKLAQTILNLAIKKDKNKDSLAEKTLRDSYPARILDPFCGTGVLLQEAGLMGYQIYGTDIDPRMIEYSKQNLQWILPDLEVKLEVADATSHQWDEPVSFIACETYLGRPLTSLPDTETLNKIVQDVNTIHKKFLQNVTRQTKNGFRMCIAIPAWKTKYGFKHLPVLDHLEELGYNRVSFVHVGTSDLIYFREDQTVARELVVLERI